ncbi:MAG: DAK2 domain-containing protein [Chloroflexota bacterium]
MSEQEISLEELSQWLLLYADYISQREGVLTELDAAIGDADHGINMCRGTEQVRRVLTGPSGPTDIATFLRTIAFTLINSIGGAAGPLYGSFFLHAANVAKQITANEALPPVSATELNQPVIGGTVTTSPAASGLQSATIEQIVAMFVGGLKGVKQRGKASMGEKTMIDALEPAILAMQDATENQMDIGTIFLSAEQAAHAGMERTVELVATKGRASYLGERSRGHQDPGATSTYFLFEAAAKIWGK